MTSLILVWVNVAFDISCSNLFFYLKSNIFLKYDKSWQLISTIQLEVQLYACILMSST